jgi:lysophospholipase L1-like esterase
MAITLTSITRRTWAVLGLLGVLAAGALATGCSSDSAASQSRLLVIGDSLVHSTTRVLIPGLRDAGWDPVVDGRSGLSIGKFAAEIDSIADAAQPRVAVVVLGTNDCAPTCADVSGGIDRIMRGLTDAGTTEVYWLNVQEQPDYPEEPGTVNAHLTEATFRWPQLRIVDLNGTIGGDPALHISDGVHFNQAGAIAFTKLITDAIDGAR